VWLVKLRAKGCSERTVKAHRDALRSLARFSQQDPADVAAETVLAWLAPMASRTRRQRASLVRSFYKFVLGLGEGDEALAALPMPRSDDEAPTAAIPGGAMEALRRAVYRRELPEPYRVAWALWDGAGLRTNEPLLLRSEHIERHAGGVTLVVARAKRHLGTVPVYEIASTGYEPAELLQRKLVRVPETPGLRLVPRSESWLWVQFQKHMRLAGVEGFQPRQVRTTFARHLEATQPLAKVQSWLRHWDAATTVRDYLRYGATKAITKGTL